MSHIATASSLNRVTIHVGFMLGQLSPLQSLPLTILLLPLDLTEQYVAGTI